MRNTVCLGINFSQTVKLDGWVPDKTEQGFVHRSLYLLRMKRKKCKKLDIKSIWTNAYVMRADLLLSVLRVDFMVWLFSACILKRVEIFGTLIWEYFADL